MNIVSRRRDEIVSKHHDEYQHFTLETALSKFFTLWGYFFSLLWIFSLLSRWSKDSNVQPALDAWKYMVFVHMFKKNIFPHIFYLLLAVFYSKHSSTKKWTTVAEIALSDLLYTRRLQTSVTIIYLFILIRGESN